MKMTLALVAAGAFGVLVLAPLSAPCLTGDCPAPAASPEDSTIPGAQVPQQAARPKPQESPMFGLFGSSSGSNAKQMIADGALVIDVRTEEEWNDGHLPTAKLLPVDDLPRRLADVTKWTGGDKTKPIVVHCRSGARSGRAQAMLKNAGFTNVVNGGGYSSLR